MEKGQTRIRAMGQAIITEVCDAKGWDTGSDGQFAPDTNSIKYKPGLSEEVADITICHELVHVIEALVGMEFTEAEVQALGFGWYTIIRDNPTFLKRIRSNAK